MKISKKIGIVAVMVLLICAGSIAALAEASSANAEKDITDSEVTANAAEGSADPFWSEKEASEYLELYSEFGMTYDKDAGKLMFEGKEIVFFIDTTKDDTVIKTFSVSSPDSSNTIKIRAERDENGVINKLRELTEDEKIEILLNNTVNESTSSTDAVITLGDESNDGSIETAIDSDTDVDLNEKLKSEYNNYQITVDEDGNVYYKGNLAGFFWDDGNYHYFSSLDSPLLLVERNTAGEITAIKEITSEQAEDISGVVLKKEIKS